MRTLRSFFAAPLRRATFGTAQKPPAHGAIYKTARQARLGGRAFLVMTSSVGLVTTVVGTPAYAGPATGGASPNRPVSGVTTLLYPLYPTATAAYAVSFKATSAVPTGGDIFLSETAGPTDFSSEKGSRRFTPSSSRTPHKSGSSRPRTSASGRALPLAPFVCVVAARLPPGPLRSR